MERRVLRSDLRDAGILDAYIGANVDDTPCGDAAKKAVIRYMKTLSVFTPKGYGLFLHGDSAAGKSFLANLVAQSAIACGHQTRVISLSFLSAVRFGGGFEGGRDSADKYFKYSYMDYLASDFLVIDDLCDPLMEERANYYLKATFHDTVKYRASARKPLIVTTRLGLTDTTPSIESLFGGSVADTLRTKCREVFVA